MDTSVKTNPKPAVTTTPLYIITEELTPLAVLFRGKKKMKPNHNKFLENNYFTFNINKLLSHERQ